MRALRRSDFDWWIVLDDVDDPADLVGLWPGGARGRTLWLTRRRGRDMEGEGRHVVMVEGFSRREGQRYLRGRLGPAVEAGEMVSHTFDEVDGLVDDLGGTPLALALAASVLRENRYTCASYRRLLADQLDGLQGLFPVEQTAEGYERPLVAAWAISLDRAEQRDPTRLASWAALMIAVLNPAGVPAKIMTTRSRTPFPRWQGPADAKNDQHRRPHADYAGAGVVQPDQLHPVRHRDRVEDPRSADARLDGPDDPASSWDRRRSPRRWSPPPTL